MTHQIPQTIILSNNVLTCAEDQFAGPAGIAVVEGRISAFGQRDEILALAGLGTEVVDFGDWTVLPGFIDPHAHGEVGSRMKALTVDCRAPGCKTIGDVQRVLREALHTARDGWLVGQANLFFDQKLEDKRLPTRDELDEVSTDVAIALRCGGHVTVLNTRGMERAGIDEEYEAVSQSLTGTPEVLRDEKGRPTGVVQEMDTLLPLPTLSEGELRDALEDGLIELFTRYGVTTIGEIGETRAGLAAMSDLHCTGTAAPRIMDYLWVPGLASLEEACGHADWSPKEADPDLFRVHGVKIFSDGGFSAKSAAMKRPYAQAHGHCGHLAMSETELEEARLRTARAGLQLAVHSNGDRAQQAVCIAIERANRALPADVPPARIEHAGNFLPDFDGTTEQWRQAGILPAPQPGFIYNYGEFIPEYVGAYAEQGRFPFRRLLDEGWPISSSSDVYVGSEQQQTNPLFSVACAVGRRAFSGAILEPEQAVSTYEALQMHTRYAAITLGVGHDRGTLEVDKLADLCVLESNPLSAEVDELSCIAVKEVWRSGERIFTGDER